MIAQIRKRNRVSLTITLLAVILLGLASRKYPFLFPAFLGKYPGDALWAIMVYLGLELLMPKASIGFIATCALAISYLDEFSQLIQTPWLNAIRNHRLEKHPMDCSPMASSYVAVIVVKD